MGSNQSIKMKNIYLINFLNFFKSKKYRIGFVINGFPSPYNKIMASTRIRVYDVIKMFWNDRDFIVELYNPLKKYDIVIFQKRFDGETRKLTKRLKKRSIKFLLDINVNYYDISSKFVMRKQREDIIKFTELADGIIVTTNFLKKIVKKLFPHKKIWLIEESMEDRFFRKRKGKKKFIKPLKLIWCGYSMKASEILLIEDILKDLYQKINYELILICEKRPKIKIGEAPIKFIKYNYSKAPDLLLRGDIFIAPRDLKDSYNLGHSFTKIGIAMAAGLPVIASPVPSYIGSPAILCRDQEEWKENLLKLFTSPSLLQELSEKGRNFARKNYSIQVIKSKYKKLFNEWMK